MNQIVKSLFKLQGEEPEEGSEKEAAREAFMEMDKDQDGMVTEEEFINAMINQEEMSSLLSVQLLEIAMVGGTAAAVDLSSSDSD